MRGNELWLVSSWSGGAPNLDKVIPGDVVYYFNADLSYHVMMVAAVDYTPARQVSQEGIWIIEAVYGNIGDSVTDRVVAVRALWDLDILRKPWVVGRLIRNDEAHN